MMASYRKKSVVIEAIQFTGANRQEIKDFGGAAAFGFHGFESVTITTLEAQMTASRDDWIIRGVKGELYPCKDSIFQMTYEEVGNDEQRGRPLLEVSACGREKNESKTGANG